jgi:predicted nucleic acid-binding protein
LYRCQGVTPRTAHISFIAEFAIANCVLLVHDDKDLGVLAGVEPVLTLM